MSHSEEPEQRLDPESFRKIKDLFKATPGDAQIILWGPEEDIPTALETVEERCQMAFTEVPRETRKTFADGTTVFERVLPGPDRMYPDTDSAPIALDKKYIEERENNLPEEIIDRYHQMKKWNVPEDTYHYIFSRNLFPLIRDISDNLGFDPRFTGAFIGHTLKFTEGHYKKHPEFKYEHLYDLFEFISKKGLSKEIAKKMLPFTYEQPGTPFEQILEKIHYNTVKRDDILKNLPALNKKFEAVKHSKNSHGKIDWLMGQLHDKALGNMPLKELREEIEKMEANH